MPLATSLPISSDDLVPAREEILAQVAKLSAHFRLPAQFIRRFDGGFSLEPTAIGKCWEAPELSEQHHLVTVSPVGDYGTHIVASERLGDNPPGAYLAVCGWADVARACEYIRVEFLNSILMHLHGRDTLPHHVLSALHNLKIQRRPANDTRLPSCSEMQFGTLLRLDQHTLTKACNYFNFSPLPEDAQLGSTALDENVCAARALSSEDDVELARIALFYNWKASAAHRDLKRWQKGGSR
jgi:hypothetical protein